MKVKLADGKERFLQHMKATTFWGADGKPISAAQFVEGLYGELPNLFKNEEELREIWSEPNTRKGLLAGLDDKGYGEEELAVISSLINAEKSDLFDVLAYIAFSNPPITREERVDTRKENIFQPYSEKQREFLSFVLGHYISEGIKELDQDKLPEMLELKYHSMGDAIAALGTVPEIRNVFVGFQRHLYE